MSADDSAQRGAPWSRLAAAHPGTLALWVQFGALGAILAAGAVLFRRDLAVPPSFDEAVYSAQADALLHGQALGSHVFAAQPPGWYWLLELAGRVGGSGLDQFRLAVLAISMLAVITAYFVGRMLAGSAAGVLAAAVLVVAPPFPTFAAQVSADLPGTVFALLALALLLFALERDNVPAALLGGGLVGWAELVKLDAFIIVLPVVLVAVQQRRGLRLFAGGAAGIALVFGVTAAALGGRLSAVWHGAVSYHQAARGVAGHYENVHALRSFFDLHQPLTYLAAAAFVATVLTDQRRKLWPYWAAFAIGVAFVLWQRPLHDNHMVLLALLLVVPIAASLAPLASRAPLLGAAALALVVVAAYVQETRRLDRNAASLPTELTSAVASVDAHSSSSQLVVSDEPIVPFLAHRRMPGQVIDTAVLRFDAGYLSNADVLRAIDRSHAPVVVAGRAFLQRPALLAGIKARLPVVREQGGVRVYLRTP